MQISSVKQKMTLEIYWMEVKFEEMVLMQDLLRKFSIKLVPAYLSFI